MVSFLLRSTCALCACSLRGQEVRPVRINKRSLRSTGVGLAAVDRQCPECGWPTHGARWAVAGLHPDDRSAVNAWRIKRGWPPIREVTG